jgi:allantoinase
MKFALHSSRVLMTDGLKEQYILIEDGMIIDVSAVTPPNVNIDECGDKIIMPGLIDTHVHVNEPGRTDWEGFETATMAAAAGGITTIVDMPLNSSPVTTNLTALNKKTDSARGKLFVNCGFYGGIIPGNISDIELLIDNGVLGMKTFLIDSGLDEFPLSAENDLRKCLPLLAEYNIPLLVHAELENKVSRKPDHNSRSFCDFVSSRPAEWEVNAIKMLIDLCREFRCHIHIVHLSAAEALPMIESAKNEGLPMTVETCPHYLFFNEEEVQNGDTRFKCTPPIRIRFNNEKLWEAVKTGLIDMIVSDHSPCPPEMKETESGNFDTAWGGISSLQFGLSAVWSEAEKRGIDIIKISELMSRNPAKLIGYENTKGKIETGYDADIVVLDPEEIFSVDEEKIFHRHKITPYLGRKLKGVVEKTYVNGVKVFENGKHTSVKPGKIIQRKHSLIH